MVSTNFSLTWDSGDTEEGIGKRLGGALTNQSLASNGHLNKGGEKGTWGRRNNKKAHRGFQNHRKLVASGPKSRGGGDVTLYLSAGRRPRRPANGNSPSLPVLGGSGSGRVPNLSQTDAATDPEFRAKKNVSPPKNEVRGQFSELGHRGLR